MIEVTVKSKKTGKVKRGSYSARELLQSNEEDIIDDMTKCDCQPVGETYVVECNCCEEWEEYDLEIKEGAE
ncbi:acetyltransferase [Bacillus inaquosorum]|uniref:acetyltransferase n=1 Tax=Bacillus inaquosorum TaxID=483913 RepID=UPI002280D4BA|nr:acetyltransferase [Bacillus inaquosorum]MCY8081747.1 acetyltransferase [Bacillus inaquosorum]MCY8704980.1 acetyltransferase [Bacillus inaquosorum]